MSARLDRAILLHHQGRYDLAEKEVRLALADDPDHPVAHAVLAQCLTNLKQYAEATDEARRAVALAPDLPLTHYTLGMVLSSRNAFAEAEEAAREAVRLDPTDPDHHALVAATRAAREDWRGALAAAEEGLSHDPEHSWCVNLRAQALVKLGRRAEAGAAMEDALARDPDDAYTHANRGWGLLNEGNPRKALDHFREALRLDPTLEWARYGMIEALKARYWVYRQVLAYFLFMARLSAQARWGIVIGLFVLQRVLASTARNNPDLAPFVEPLLYAYIAFAVTTWTAVPLSNLLLRLNRYGRYALDRDQRRASNWVGVCVVLALHGVGWGLFAAEEVAWMGWVSALGFMILLLPVAATFACHEGWPRRVMAAYTLGMAFLVTAAVGLFALTLVFVRPESDEAKLCLGAALLLLQINIWAGLLSGFLANWLIGKQPRQ